jgi:hypothetical protein
LLNSAKVSVSADAAAANGASFRGDGTIRRSRMRRREANPRHVRRDPAKIAEPVNGLTLFSPRPCLPERSERMCGATEMTTFHGEFNIESFEAGSGLWHARIRRTNKEPLIINGVAFPHLEVGFAWPDRAAAIEDAKTQIDRFGPRWDARDDTSARQLSAVA